MVLTKGVYELRFEKEDDDGVTGSVEIEVQEDEEFKYRISCTSSGIKVKAIADEVSSGDEESTSSEVEQDSMLTESEETESTSDETVDTTNTVSYSTNTKDTVKDGNAGVYAYMDDVGSYDIYWIIDFDEGCVYRFTYRTEDSICDRIQIDSGDLNSVLIITYHDGGDTWSRGLHFKYKNQPDTLVMQEEGGAEYEYYTTNLD